MSFPRYPKYKASGVEWLGELPEHWRTAPLKKVATHNDDVLDENTSPDVEIVYVDISGVDGVNGITAKETMSFANAPSRARRRVRHGDVIVSTVRTYLRAIACVCDPEENLIVSTGFAVVRPRDDLVSKFVGHVLSASYFVEQVIARSTGVSYPAINASDLVAIPILVPPRDEQTKIASFLDRETSKIDSLVGEQRRLIELLKEKRQAVISHAVTKGLNPHAPLKPSGFEWLGDVPEHWSVVPIKRLIDVKDGTHATPSYVDQSDDAFPLITSKDFQDDEICFDQAKYISASDHDEIIRRSNTEAGDVLMSMIGGNIGKALVNNATRPFSIKNVALFKTTHNPTLASFILYYLQSGLLDVQIDLLSRGGAQGFLGLGDIRNLVFFKITPTERSEIVRHLDSETAKLDALTAEAERAIELLQERRTALISAAVTGQIDVRGLVDTAAG